MRGSAERGIQGWRLRKRLLVALLQTKQLLLQGELLVLRVELLNLALEGVVLVNLRVEHERDFVDLSQAHRVVSLMRC